MCPFDLVLTLGQCKCYPVAVDDVWMAAEFAAIARELEPPGDPAHPDSPLGRFIAAGVLSDDAVLAMWAESDPFWGTLRGRDPSR